MLVGCNFIYFSMFQYCREDDNPVYGIYGKNEEGDYEEGEIVFTDENPDYEATENV